MRARRLLWRLADVWHGLAFRWYTTDKSGLAFVAMLACPIVMLAGLTRFAYADHVRRQADQQRRVDLKCLAENVYYEARGESAAGQQAIAEVTLNRVASGQFPDTICAVVHEQRWDAVRREHPQAPDLTRAISRRYEKFVPTRDVPVLTDDYAPTDALILVD